MTAPSTQTSLISKLACRTIYPLFACGAITLLLISLSAAKNKPAAVNLSPRFHAGQTLSYQISYHSDKHIKTESSVIVATPADSAKIDVNALLNLEILGVQAQADRAIVRARTKFQVLDSDSRFNTPQFDAPSHQVQRQDPKGKFVDFTILADGRLAQLTGLDALFPEQQQTWQEWASRFLFGAELRTSSARVSQKWTSAQPEKSPGPIAGLRWLRQSTYVRDEPCRAVQLTVQGTVASSDAESETCAVILTTATLNQNSNQKNATPEDFKLHQLRTSGTAHGSNRIITYISLKTGLLMRATEEATQQMSVTVAKADGSNRVHYDVNAKSHSEVVLVVQTALDPDNTK
jgi:hypothetical protein